jgi:hypothetical protein
MSVRAMKRDGGIMFNFNRFPAQDLEWGNSARSAFLPTELRLARLQMTITAAQQRLKQLHWHMRKTSPMSQEAARVLRSIKTTVLLNRSTLQRIKESANIVASCNDDDTLQQIQRADHVLTRFYRVDNLTKQAHTGLKSRT